MALTRVRNLFGKVGAKYVLLMLVVTGVAFAILKTHKGDNLYVRSFSVKTISGGNVKGTVLFPKPAARYPVVIYVHGFHESPLLVETELRQIAELNMAAVDIDYDEANSTAFDGQFLALQSYLAKQAWVETNAVAWVGSSLGAEHVLDFALNHPETQPQLLVRLSGGWLAKLDQYVNEPGALPIRCPVLLIHGENDQVFPVEDSKRLADLLHAAGIIETLHVLPELNHYFGDNRGMVIRAVAEYCRAHLPLADYTANLPGCRLDRAECQRFNVAMQRAGQNRGELWEAVKSTREPERRTIMMVIGGLEDYDLAHMTGAHLKQNVRIAWQARKKYPWCRDTPLDIFEKYTANPRIYEEPIDSFQPVFSRRLERVVKYCRTTQEASDAVWKWMQQMVKWGGDEFTGREKSPQEVLAAGTGGCESMAMLYTALCRAIGLPERTTMVIWQNSLGTHYCTEVWSVQEGRWRELDSTARDRPYDFNWIRRVPKAMILTATGERGGWNARAENRLDAYLNTIELVYPSGKLAVKVMDHDQPAVGQRILIQLPSVIGLVKMTQLLTDNRGEANVVLGESAKYPYRVLIDLPGNRDWQWVEVHSNQSYHVTLRLENERSFDASRQPPPLEHTNTPAS